MPPLPIFLGAAVVDSINPCAFGVLIFMLAYLSKSVKKRSHILSRGLAYILAVFITYLVGGLILMPIIGSLGQLSVTFYGIIGAITIFFGLLEIKDFFWYGKGPSLALIPGASKRVKYYAKYVSDSLVSAFLMGVFVALVELPCTGAVYLAILSMMALAGAQANTVFWLIVYNIIFVIPLFMILLVFQMGLKAKTLESWRQDNKKAMRLLIGSLLILLGGWMINTAYF